MTFKNCGNTEKLDKISDALLELTLFSQVCFLLKAFFNNKTLVSMLCGRVGRCVDPSLCHVLLYHVLDHDCAVTIIILTIQILIDTISTSDG